MSRHRKETIYKTTTERLAKGVGGGMLAAAALVGSFALAADAMPRIAHEQFDAPIAVDGPLHEFADSLTPDFVYDPLESNMDPIAFAATELGVSVLGWALVGQGAALVQRALRRPPQPEQAPPQVPPAAPPQ